MKVDGSCICGKIQFEAVVDARETCICHCLDCQSLSGTAFRVSAPARCEELKMLQGTPAVFVKTATSGNRRIQAFCGECGTALYAMPLVDPKIVNIRVGTLRQRNELVPRKQIWPRSALRWMPELDHLRSWDEEQV